MALCVIIVLFPQLPFVTANYSVSFKQRLLGSMSAVIIMGVLYEYVRVVTHPRVLEEPLTAAEAWRFVNALRSSPSLEILVETDRHADVLASILESMPNVAGTILHDVHTAALMKEHGVSRIATRDTDFHRFPFLEPFDPVP